MNTLLLVVFPLAMIFGALWDLTTMTIPNWLTIALAAMFFALAPFAGLTAAQIGLHVAAGGVMLVVGMVLFGFGWIGGGDAKFVAAAALWIGWNDLLPYLFVASLAGGALTLIILSFRRFPLPSIAYRQDWIARLHDRETGIPYGIALAAAGLFIFPNSVWVKLAAVAA